MPSLKLAERHLLRYPPTPKTWVCSKCSTPLAGSMDDCWYCHEIKPARPKLLWPKYLEACAKACHTPGEKWPPKDAVTETRPSPNRPFRSIKRKAAG